MAEVVIRVRDNGPYLVEGPVTVLDASGKAFPIDKARPATALCRCGASAKKPFCDGAHQAAGFQAADRAPTAD
ncbi:MAG: CDGSH iron-sulfur domain-containing protein [Candidatus Anammoximicrobium sp.]|nr:CDGSH iron-sulfur domain-containing protein [Candidatus Anammoximicrobium sp.]